MSARCGDRAGGDLGVRGSRKNCWVRQIAAVDVAGCGSKEVHAIVAELDKRRNQILGSLRRRLIPFDRGERRLGAH